MKKPIRRIGGARSGGFAQQESSFVYTGPLIAPVGAGREVARLKIFRGTEQVLDLPLKTTAAVEQGSLPRRAMDAGLEYATVLFRKYVLKK